MDSDLRSASIGAATALGGIAALWALARISRPARSHLANAIIWSVDDSFQEVKRLLREEVSGEELNAAIAESDWGYRRLVPLALRLDRHVLEDFPAHLDWVHDDSEAIVYHLSSDQSGGLGEGLTLVGRA